MRRIGPNVSPGMERFLEEIFLPSICKFVYDGRVYIDEERLIEELFLADVVAGTMGAARYQKNLPVRLFDNVVVDEAAQAYEAETPGVLLLAKRRVVLLGDHHQLSAKIRQDHLRRAGFDRSLLGRCWNGSGHAKVYGILYQTFRLF